MVHPDRFRGTNRTWARSAGYTVLELLVTTTISAVIGLLFYSSVRTLAPRLDLQGAADEIVFLAARARLEAIQRGVPVVLQVDLEHDELFAFADVNGNSVPGSPGFESYLRFDPKWKDGVYDAGLGHKQTDYEVGLVRLYRCSFGSPGGGPPVEGLTRVPGATEDSTPVLVFLPDGVPRDLGSLGLADHSGFDGEAMNHLEIAIANITGRIETRKYLRPEDSPTAVAGFFPAGKNSAGENLWVWY